MSVSIAVKDACSEAGDSPHWEDSTQSVIYVDVWKGSVFRWDPLKSTNDEFIRVGKPVSFVLPCKKENRYILSQGTKLCYIDLPPKPIKPVFGEKKPFSEPATTMLEVEDESNHRLSAGKCDSKGRLWTGTMGDEEGLLDHLDSVAKDAKQLTPSLEADCSALYRLQHTTTDESPETPVPVVQTYHKPVCISNGITWNMDNTNMYFVDSCARKVFCFDFDQETGAISHKREAVSFGSGTFQQWGFPAGITMDTAGKLWISCYNAAKVARFDPETGKELSNVVIPGAKRITSCCFGGKNYDEMYVTTSRRHVTELEFLTNQGNAGSLFKITGLGVRGAPGNEYHC